MSALFSLSKAAQEAANATVDFYGALAGQELPHNFLNLAATLGHVSKDLSGTLDEPNGDASGAAAPKKATVKKEKRIVDPNAPKKPTTSYFSFAADRRRVIRTERERQGLPPLGNSEITLDIATRWNNLTDAQKEPWNKKYKEEMVQYTKDKEAYIKSKEAKFQPPAPAAAAEPAPAAAAAPAKATKSKATPKKAAAKAAPVKEVEEDDDLVAKVDEDEEDEEPEAVQAPPPSTRKAKAAAAAASETPSKSTKRKAKEPAVAEPASTKKKEKKEKKARKSEASF